MDGCDSWVLARVCRGSSYASWASCVSRNDGTENDFQEAIKYQQCSCCRCFWGRIKDRRESGSSLMLLLSARAHVDMRGLIRFCRNCTKAEAQKIRLEGSVGICKGN